MNKSSPAFIELEKKIQSYWLNPDPVALKVIFAAMVSFEFDCDPVWLFLIAPPSSLKTEFINGLDMIESIYPLSSLTPKTFASGMRAKKGESNSLLEQIKSKVVTFKDFTSLLTKRYEDLQEILGQLREIYDGKFKADFGSGVKVNWKGKLGFIAGVTPIIDRYSSVSSNLGERFIQYRLPGVRDEEVAAMAIEQSVRPSSYREEVQQLFYDFYQQLDVPESLREIDMSREFIIKLSAICSLVVKSRAGTVRDSYKNELVYVPAPESPARLAKQLSILGRCLSIVNSNTEFTEKEYKILLKVAFDTIPHQRLLILNALFGGAEMTSPEVSEVIGYSTTATTGYLEDMAAFGVVKVEKTGNKHLWSISEMTKTYLMASLVDVTHPESYVTNIFKWWRESSDNLDSII